MEKGRDSSLAVRAGPRSRALGSLPNVDDALLDDIASATVEQVVPGAAEGVLQPGEGGDPHSWICKIETGERRLDVCEYLALCRAIGCDYQEGMRKLAGAVGNRRRT